MKTTQTRDYHRFISDKTNRPITDRDRSTLKRLRASMVKYGFLPFPILVRREGNALKVIDGQHRLMVAQELKLSVMYIETDRTDIVISECAGGQQPWILHHYVASNAAQGKEAYQEILDFAAEHKMPLNQSASLLWGEAAYGGNVNKVIKDGRFVVKDRAYATRVARLVEVVAQHADWAKNTTSLGALSRFVRVDQFSDEQFIKRVSAHPHMLRHQPTIDLFAEMYEQVYNHASRTRIPLSFLAREAAASRSPLQGKRTA